MSPTSRPLPSTVFFHIVFPIKISSESPLIPHGSELNVTFGLNTVEIGGSGVGGCQFRPFAKGIPFHSDLKETGDRLYDAYGLSIGSTHGNHCGQQLLLVSILI
jgi:hypothetical protein